MKYIYICEPEVTKIVTLSSQIPNNDIIYTVYSDNRTVFRLNDIAMLLFESNTGLLKRRLHYYVSTGRLLHPRKGIYAKPGYKPAELGCKLYTPCYISLQFVLRKAGVVFQYDTGITCVSYLTRIVEVNGISFSYRKIKDAILENTTGIVRNKDHINIATAERAFLDLLYLEKDYHFDNIGILDRDNVHGLLPLYGSKALKARVKKLFGND